ncbi:TPA: dual specificity phosphatase 12, variant 2 [Trebouxia sp. C0004]
MVIHIALFLINDRLCLEKYRLCTTGLYLGGLHSLQHAPQIGLTHLVTVLPSLNVLQESPDFLHPLDKRYKRLHVKLDDADHANLLLHLPSASAFIQSALYGGGKVLVHCAAGISRSATVVMAYLMETEQLTPEEALQAVRQHAPWVDPNPGFKHQLTLFAAMGHKLDPEYEPYRAMLLAQQRQLATLNTRPLPKQSKSGDWVCKQCSRLLVTADRVINSQRGDADGASHQAQQCILVKPQRWMGASMSSASGGTGSSIVCPNCGTTVGVFEWGSYPVSGIADLHTPAGIQHPLPSLFFTVIEQHQAHASSLDPFSHSSDT